MYSLRRSTLFPFVACAAAMIGLAVGIAAGDETRLVNCGIEINAAVETLASPSGPLHPLLPSRSDRTDSALALDLDPLVIVQMLGQQDWFEIDLPVMCGETVRALVIRFEPLAPGAVALIEQADGSTVLVAPTVSVFRGFTIDDPHSNVFLAIGPDQAHGWVTTNGGTHIYSTPTVRGQRRVLVSNAGSLRVGGRTICAGAIEPPNAALPPPTGPDTGLRLVPLCRAFDIAVECDLEFTQTQPSAQAAADYAVVMTAAASSIYSREAGIGLRISFLRVWNREDPWTEPDAGSQLTQFREYWLANMSEIPRATTHLLSGRGLGGGVAYLRTICDAQWSYGVSGNLAGTFPFPILNNSGANWDLHVYAHELGHILGTHHTHNVCEYDPIVDACGLNPDPDAGCEHGQPDCTVADAGAGTIMSYCHTCAGGESNLVMMLGSRVSARVAEFTAGRACGVTLEPTMFTGIGVSPELPACAGSPIQLSALASGPDLRFQWFRNGQRLDAARLPTLAIPTPQAGDRYDVMVYSPCTLVRTLGTPLGITIETTPCCLADVDGNGMLQVTDIFAFLSAWFAGDPSADIDGTAGIAVPDIFAFLSLWFAGCP